MDRRAFLATSLWSLAHATRPARGAAALRIATIADASRRDLSAGLAFGFAEAGYSARLFGWTVERVEIAPGASRRPEATATAVVVAASHAPPPAPLVLRLVCDGPPWEGHFLLAPCEAGEEAWHASLERFGAGELNARYRAGTGSPMTSDAWLGWFAVKLLLDSALRLRTTDPARIRDHLLRGDTRFDGHKGVPLRFDGSRRLVQPLYDARGTPL